MKRSGKTTWFLKNLGVDEAVIGDLVEQHDSGRSRAWCWRQVLMASLHVARTHALLMIGTVLLGWAVLWMFFRFVGSPLARFDEYLLGSGLIERYSAGWWLRSILMWIVVGFPFLASGWIVAKLAWRTPLLPVLTFAVSVSTAVLIALILDTGSGGSGEGSTSWLVDGSVVSDCCSGDNDCGRRVCRGYSRAQRR
jgi:hypothetical protein